MDKISDMYKAFLFKGRFACYACLSIIPLLQKEAQLLFLVTGIVVSIIILIIENQAQRIRLLMIWLVGIASSIAIVLVISNWFIQLVLYLICLMVAAGLIYEMSGREISETEPKAK